MIPTQIPNELRAGDTWRWTRDLADYPAGTWTATYYLQNASKSISFAASASGTTHSVSVAASATAAYTPGRYRWFLRLTDGTIVETPDSEQGWVDVLADPARGATDHRSNARKRLEMIDAYLIDPGNLEASQFSIAGRQISRWARADLLVERDKAKTEVDAEEAAARVAAGLGNPRRLYVRFDRG